jgi:hypothetical protein
MKKGIQASDLGRLTLEYKIFIQEFFWNLTAELSTQIR